MSAVAVRSSVARSSVRPATGRRSSVVVRSDAAFIGSTTNIIMVASTTAFLTAARFGLAPTVKKMATPRLKLVERDIGLISGDPAGFTAVDVLAYGTIGHVVAVGAILGLKATGQL
ncbi:MAG: hypothetical protein WDW38_002472 [Sanguina aurantia]